MADKTAQGLRMLRRCRAFCARRPRSPRLRAFSARTTVACACTPPPLPPPPACWATYRPDACERPWRVTSSSRAADTARPASTPTSSPLGPLELPPTAPSADRPADGE
eukprot:2098331-Prymnesium_polylepis.1